jgi:RHS repeat-associated protein
VLVYWTHFSRWLSRISLKIDRRECSSSQSVASGIPIQYDAFGNRTAQDSQTAACPSTPTATATYNGYNQLSWTSVNAAGSNVSYDAAGNMLYDGRNSYLYDAEGRVCAVQEVVSGTTFLTGYVYDASGTRVARDSLTTFSCNFSSNGYKINTSWVLGLGGEQVTEYSVSGSPGSYSSTWAHTNVFAGGKLLATYNGTDTYFALEDWLGTKRAESSAGGCFSTFTGLPFGDGLTPSGNCTDATEHHFTGKERDAESGNDYFEARYYSSAMGRFMSPDWSAKVQPVPYAKLGDPQSLNLYAYVGNNPMIHIDADGHCWPQWLCNAAQAAFGTAAQLLNDGLQRAGYKAAASQLSGPGASAARKSLQASTYNKLSPVGQSITDAAKQSRAGQLAGKTADQLAESASKTNAGVNALGDASKTLGAVGVAAGVASVVVDTVQAPDGQKSITALTGTATLGGSLEGAEVGGAVGAEAGPWGALGGSILGGIFGADAVKSVVSSQGAVAPDGTTVYYQPY